MMKSKKKSKHDLPSLDFVTALSIEECRERVHSLAKVRDNSGRHITLGSNYRFEAEYILEGSGKEDSIPFRTGQIDLGKVFTPSIKYSGRMSVCDDGTHIQVLPTQRNLAMPWYYQLLTEPAVFVAGIIAMISAVYALSSGNYAMLYIIWLFFVLWVEFVAVISNIPVGLDSQIAIGSYAEWLLEWVQEHLYVPVAVKDQSDAS